MVNVDLVTIPPTKQDFQDAELIFKKQRNSFVVVLWANLAFFLGQIALIWFLKKVNSEQVNLIILVPVVSFIVSLLLSDHVRQSFALCAGFVSGLVFLMLIGLPIPFESQVLLAIVSSGTGGITFYILDNIEAMNQKIQKVMPINDSDYAWLCLAAQKCPFIANYLLQVRFSGREDIYGEELLQLMLNPPENIDASLVDFIDHPKMVLWSYLDTVG
jgi:hypothetical protein